MALTCQFDATEDALHECDYGLVATEVDELLQAAGMPLLAHDSLDFKGLCRMLPLARQDVLQIESNRWNGVYKQPRPMGGLAPSPAPPSHQAVNHSLIMVTLYFKENSKAVRTDSQIKAEFEQLFVILAGIGRLRLSPRWIVNLHGWERSRLWRTRN